MNIGFRVGKNLGNLLGTLAQEKLLIDLDILGSLSIFSNCLGIEDKDILLELLSGREKGLSIDEENQVAVFVDRDENLNYPILKSKETIDSWLETIRVDIEEIRDALNLGCNYIKSNKAVKSIKLEIPVDLSIFISIITGNIRQTKEKLYDSFADYFQNEEDGYFYQMEGLCNILINCLDWIKRTLKKFNIIEFIIDNDLGTVWNYSKDGYSNCLTMEKRGLVHIYYRLVDITRILDLNDLLNDLITSIKPKLLEDKIMSEMISHVIIPVNISDGYSAGWLSPEGDYYGMNGEISSMLHVSLAESLKEEGIIPIVDNYTPDYWLEENGWVKIHGNQIFFSLGIDEEKDLTEKQIEQIAIYGKVVFGGFLRFGYKQTLLSMNNFKGLDMYARKQLFSI